MLKKRKHYINQNKEKEGIWASSVVTTTKNKQLRQQAVVTLVLQAQVVTQVHGLPQLTTVVATVAFLQQLQALVMAVLECLQQAVTAVPHKVVATVAFLQLNRIEPSATKARLLWRVF
jgi:hypothetical protein